MWREVENKEAEVERRKVKIFGGKEEVLGVDACAACAIPTRGGCLEIPFSLITPSATMEGPPPLVFFLALG